MPPQEGNEARPLSSLPQPLLKLRRRLLLVKFVAERLRLRQQVFLPHALAALLEFFGRGGRTSDYESPFELYTDVLAQTTSN